MEVMKTTIIYNGVTYTQTFIESKYRIMVSDNGMVKTPLAKIKSDKCNLFAVCSDCGRGINTSYKSRFVHTSYLCHKCSVTGKRNPFYGKKHSEKTRQIQSEVKIGKYDGEKNPMFGVSWKDIVRSKIGNDGFKEYLSVRNKKHSDRMCGEKNPFYGKTHSEDTIRIISNANKIYSSNPSVKNKQRELALNRLSSNRYRMTKPEKIMKSILSELSVPNHYNFILGKRYQYDFKVKESNIIIEVQGDYWHCNPKMYPNGPISDRQRFKMQRDIDKKSYAEEHGYSVLYVWEDELKNNVELVKQKVMYEIQAKENRKD